MADLSSAEDKLMLQMFQPLLNSRQTELEIGQRKGLNARKLKTKKLGKSEVHATTYSVQAKKAEGVSQSKTAEVLGLGIVTVKRHWNKAITAV